MINQQQEPQQIISLRENAHVVNRNICDDNKELLNKLFKKDLSPSKYTDKLNEFSSNCTICLEDYTLNSKVIRLPCKHIFHFNCLKDWLFKNLLLPKCPNCNYRVIEDGGHENNLNNNDNNNIIILNNNLVNSNNQQGINRNVPVVNNFVDNRINIIHSQISSNFNSESNESSSVRNNNINRNVMRISNQVPIRPRNTDIIRNNYITD